MVLAFQRPSSLRTGHFLLRASFLDAPTPLGLVLCLFLVATQHPILGLYVISHYKVELSGCLFFFPVIIKWLESQILFFYLVVYGQVQNMAPWRWSENVCGVHDTTSNRAQKQVLAKWNHSKLNCMCQELPLSWKTGQCRPNFHTYGLRLLQSE